MFDSNCLAYLKSKSCALKPMLPPVLGSLGWIVPCRIRPVASCDDSWSGLQCHVEWSQSHHGGEMVYMVYGMKLQQVNIHVNSQDLKEKCVVVSKKYCKYSPWRIGEDGSTGGEKPPSGNSPCCWIGLCVCTILVVKADSTTESPYFQMVLKSKDCFVHFPQGSLNGHPVFAWFLHWNKSADFCLTPFFRCFKF